MRLNMFSTAEREAGYQRLPDEFDPDVGSPESTETSLAERITQQTTDWIGRHPLVCVSVGVALGATLGWLIKRR